MLRGASDRIAAEGRNGVALHAVGVYPPVLDTEHLAAGAAPAGLHFVADEQAAVFSNNADDLFEIFFGRHDETADALNRLGEKRSDSSLRSHGLNRFFGVFSALQIATGI